MFVKYNQFLQSSGLLVFFLSMHSGAWLCVNECSFVCTDLHACYLYVLDDFKIVATVSIVVKIS